jgi:SAM-dependent methyltransferase
VDESQRKPQLAYSELQYKTHDERKRRRKAVKIVSVLEHFLGRQDLSGLSAIDIGCSTGYTVDTLQASGATVTGFDIDVPGIEHAKALFGDRAEFVVADGSQLGLPDKSVDIVVFNHIYEHVVDPAAVMKEIRRVLADDGVVYLGLGNKRAIIEPHYRLPFLSWLPRRAADRYVSAFHRADDYYEHFDTKAGLLRLCKGLSVWDYTYTVLSDSTGFNATDIVPARLAGLPPMLWRAFAPIMPTFIWIGTPGRRRPAGPATRQDPTLLASSAGDAH